MDPGFESGGGCGATFRTDRPIRIERGARVAQIVFHEASAASVYSGQYQNS